MQVSQELPQARYGYLLYDGTCGVCSTFIGNRADFYTRHGFGIVQAQDPRVQSRLEALNGFALNEIRLLTNDGQLITGANVYREITARIWWLKPVNWISRLPICRQIFNFAYQTFASNRHNISRVCGLSGNAHIR